MRDNRRQAARRTLGAERGSAMVTVVLVTTVTTLLATVLLIAATSSIRQGGARNLWEQSVHLAEAGVARAVTRVSAEQLYDTGDSLSASPTKAEVVSAAADNPLESAAQGEYSWVVSSGSSIAYGIGYVPSRAAAEHTRVVRVHYSVVNTGGARAILAQGDLEVSGNVSVTEVGGSVHSNRNLTVGGTSLTIEDDATASGSFTMNGSPTIGGQYGGGYPIIPLPEINPDLYRPKADYDVCPDGTIRTMSGGIPCTGALVGTGLALDWNGWQLQGGKWTVNCKKAAASGLSDNRSYYVYNNTLDAQCPNGSYIWRTTLLAKAAGTPGSYLNGDVIISGGSAKLQAAKEGVLAVSGRDLRWTGSVEITGFLASAEHVEISGNNTSFYGSVMVAGTQDSAGSPVSRNTVGGGFSMYAVFGAPDTQGGVATSRWEELPG